MAADFGSILREARLRRGDDVITVARNIRIRPDIIDTIENSDLAAMPDRGYARNMINAYARYLGLDASAIVTMYLEAEMESQTNMAKSAIRSGNSQSLSNGRDVRRTSQTANASEPFHRETYTPVSSYRDPRSQESASSRNQPSRIDGIDRRTATRSLRGYGRSSGHSISEGVQSLSGHIGIGSSVNSAPRRDVIRLDHETGSSQLHFQKGNRGGYGSARSSMPKTRGSSISASLGGQRNYMPFIVAAVIILLIAIIVILGSNLMKSGTSDSTAATTSVNITGLPDNTAENYNDTSATTATPVAVAPTQTVIEYSVPDGSSAYLEISVDGTYDVAGDVTGPQTGSYTLDADHDSLTFVCVGDDVTLTQDGEAVDLTADDSGVASVEFSFSKILEEWNKEHSTEAEASTDTSSTSSSDSSAEESSSDDSSSDEEDSTESE